MSNSHGSRTTADAENRVEDVHPDPDARHEDRAPAESPQHARSRDRAPAMPVGKLGDELLVFLRNAALFVAGVAMISVGYVMYAVSGQFDFVPVILSTFGALCLLAGAVLGGLSIVSMSVAAQRESKTPEPPTPGS